MNEEERAERAALRVRIGRLEGALEDLRQIGLLSCVIEERCGNCIRCRALATLKDEEKVCRDECPQEGCDELCSNWYCTQHGYFGPTVP